MGTFNNDTKTQIAISDEFIFYQDVTYSIFREGKSFQNILAFQLFVTVLENLCTLFIAIYARTEQQWNLYFNLLQN